jgi:hypothetical protein
MTLRRVTLVGFLLAGCIMRQPGPATTASGGAASTDPDAMPTPELPPDLPASVSLIGDKGLDSFALGGDKTKAEVKKIAVEGQEFSEALEADIKASSNSEWTVQVSALIAAPVEKGDVLFASFWVRATKLREDGTAETQFVFEKASAPYTKSVTHSIGLGTEWRKVYVRFMSGQSYAPGEAQMIFRLGYDPETFQIGGIKVENFGKKVALAVLPTTQGRDRPRPPKAEPAIAVKDGGTLTFEVTPDKVLGPISPYVYGVNSQKTGDTRATVRRMGGNRQTAYNWEINASNAGSDYQHSNDDWPCTNLGYTDCEVPGAQFIDFVLENQKRSEQSLVTIPMLDWVSADKKGGVKEADKPPSKRWNRSFPKNPAGAAEKPDLADGKVYQDEFVRALVKRFGTASKGGVKFYSLDNEPALWPSTHPRIHPAPTTYKEIAERTEATAAMITEIDPSAEVLGAVAFGWSEFMSLSSAPDQNKEYATYLEYYLANAKKLEEKYGRRLVHVLDVHWYPEVKGYKRITEEDKSQRTTDARVGATRSFWDPTYREKSWIGDQWGKPIRLIPWLKELADKHYPGTKVSMTEYNFGTGDHISGGIAQADVLGTFGREGLYVGNYWGNGAGVGPLPKYITAAFKLFRNYDGKGGAFGDTAVHATFDPEKTSVYAATDSKVPGRLTVVVINKDQRASYTAAIKVAGGAMCAKAKAYRFDGSSADVIAVPPPNVVGGELRASLPALSATMLVCEKG